MNKQIVLLDSNDLPIVCSIELSVQEDYQQLESHGRLYWEKYCSVDLESMSFEKDGIEYLPTKTELKEWNKEITGAMSL